jgi:hypothetical protein
LFVRLVAIDARAHSVFYGVGFVGFDSFLGVAFVVFLAVEFPTNPTRQA